MIKETKVTPGSNLIWVSNFILPEHKEQANRHDLELCKCLKPVLDEQQHEEIIRTLAVAIFADKEATVTVWGDYENETIVGKLTRLDKQLKRIKVEKNDEY